MNKRKRQFYGMNVGSASMVLIFVILCIVSFAALSIVSANADHRLTEKIAERTLKYYEACNIAEESLVQIDKALAEQYAVSASINDYFQAVGHSKSYVIPISESQTLFVEIKIQYPKTDDASFYSIESWQVIENE